MNISMYRRLYRELESVVLFHSRTRIVKMSTKIPLPVTTKTVIAVCQMCSTSDKEQNLAACKELINNAVQCGAKMIFLPEACDFITGDRLKMSEMFESITGPTITFIKSLAKTKKVWVSVGGFHEQDPSTNLLYVTHVIIDDCGEIQGVYRKTHLFSISNKRDGTSLNESDIITPGDDIKKIIQTPCGKVGMQICYDVRFSEVSNLQTKLGAEILTFPSAFTLLTGMAHWSTLLRARAIENQCYVVAAAQTGHHSEKRVSYGHAMIVDPWGNVLCECGEGQNVGIGIVDLNYLREVRTRMPVWNHRRYNLY